MRRSIFGAALLLCAVSLPFQYAEAHKAMTPWLRFAQAGQQQCDQPWQMRDGNGNCVDSPGTFRPPAGYAPGSGDTCWAECECFNGATPAADNCAPCSYVGAVCKRN
jgi:hypothetical protein